MHWCILNQTLPIQPCVHVYHHCLSYCWYTYLQSRFAAETPCGLPESWVKQYLSDLGYRRSQCYDVRECIIVPRDGVVVVGEYPHNLRNHICYHHGVAPSNLFSGDPSISSPKAGKPESWGCNLWCHPGAPPGVTVKMKRNLVKLSLRCFGDVRFES